MGLAQKEINTTPAESEVNLLLDDTGINIWIDKYIDVFSDFDTRPLVNRRLSHDFVGEIVKMVRETPGNDAELNFNILDDTRDTEVEAIITNHLKNHFINCRKAEQEEIKQTFRKGYMMTSAGFLIILGLAYIAQVAKGAFFMNSLPVLMDPLAWFVTWTGLDHIFKNYGNDKSKVDVNQRMINAKISFSCLGGMPVVNEEPVVAPKQKKVIPAGNNLRIA
jgi:hypothetical protein